MQMERQYFQSFFRIVNGYVPGLRGWMVMLRIFPSDDINSYETCGGALLNKRFVLSAAHCVILKYNSNNKYFNKKLD